jgi:transcriptional regulator with XRE-family HTH domain
MREGARLTLEEVAAALGYSDSKISRIETGKISVTPGDVRNMLVLYGASEEQLEGLTQVAREEREKKWWHAYRDVFQSPYVTYEAAAASIDSYGALLVPGLLQTKEYAAAVLRGLRPHASPEDTARRVEFRMLRQLILAGEHSPRLSVVLDEAVLRRRVGGREVMLGQLHRLLKASTHPSITLQVLEFNAGEHPGMHGPITLIRFMEEGESDMVLFEAPTRSVMYTDDPQVVKDSSAALDLLKRVALKPDESAVFLSELAKEL